MNQGKNEKKLCWRVTRYCNLHCRHCLAGHGNQIRRDLTYTEQLFCLEQMSSAGISRITWTGGEPTLAKNFPELLRVCHSLGIRSLITTHGLAQMDRLLTELDQTSDTLRISFDGLERTHNLIRGGDFFEKTLRNARLYANRGLTVEANVTVLEQNVKELPSLITLLSENGISKVVLMTLMQRESAVDNRIKGISGDQKNRLQQLLGEIKAQISHLVVQFNDYDEPTDRYIVIESDGEILLCSEVKDDLGFGYLQSQGADALRAALNQQTLAHRQDGFQRL